MSINEVVVFAMTTCKTATPEDRLLFKVWCVAACRDIGSNKDWYKVTVLYPEDFSFKKPDDLVSTVAISLYDSSDQEIRYNFNQGSKRIFPDRFQINTDSSTAQITGRIDLSEDAHYFHMGTNATEVQYALVRYLGMPVDQEGFPLIREDNLLAYEAFCKYMYAKRVNDNRSEIDQNYSIWLKERDKIKGKNKMPSQVEAEATFARYMSLINAPIYNTF